MYEQDVILIFYHELRVKSGYKKIVNVFERFEVNFLNNIFIQNKNTSFLIM